MFKISNSSQQPSQTSSHINQSKPSYPSIQLPQYHLLYKQKSLFTTQSFPFHSLSKKTSRFHIDSLYDKKGRWSKEEQDRFIEGIILYGVDWKKVQKHISTRSSTQARSHAQKFLLKLKHCDMIRNRNINLNYSWSKSIQMLQKEFTQKEMETVLQSVCIKKKYSSNKESKKQCLCTINNDQSDITTMDDNNERDDEWMRKDNNEYIRTFIESFKIKKDSFDINDDELYCAMN